MAEDVEIKKDLEYQIGLSALLVGICNPASVIELNRATKTLNQLKGSKVLSDEEFERLEETIHSVSRDFYGRCNCEGRHGAPATTLSVGSKVYYMDRRIKAFVNVTDPDDIVKMEDLIGK